MKKLNTKMKLLSLALLGLGGMALAGSAAAACPAGPDKPNGGAWDSLTEFGSGSSFAVVAGGLDGSDCKGVSTLGASVTAAAQVVDDLDLSEPSYRFQFLIDTNALSSFGGTDSVMLFRLSGSNAAHGMLQLLEVYLSPGPAGAKRLRFVASCNTAPTYRCSSDYTTDLNNGVNRIEGKLTLGAGGAGQLDYWVNVGAGTSEPAPSGTIANLDNAAWTGAKQARLGLSGPTSSFKNNHAGEGVGFDTFDSRRNTYIGH